MNKVVTTIVLLALSLSIVRVADARRGNPAPNNNAKYQLYLLDSDDNDPRSPSYDFVDTLFDPTNWHRVAFNFVAPDTIAFLSPVAGANFEFYQSNIAFPFKYFSRFGVMTSDTFNMAAREIANNVAIPTGASGTFRGVIAPLWGDMEFRHAGDSSKVFWRTNAAKDSFYVTYYNLFLNKTNGQVRSTFQVVVAKADSSITFNYRSFDGSFAGVPAATMFQKLATIGLQNFQAIWGNCYLDRATYYAKSYSSQIYAQNLHNNLSIRFFPDIPNFIRLKSIDTPPKDGWETNSNNLTPQITIENLKSQSRTVYYQIKITNLFNGFQAYSRTDSVLLGFNDVVQRSGTTMQSLTCGYYRMTATAWIPSMGTLPTDNWDPDNTLTRDFVYLNTGSVPFYDDFPILDPCYWKYNGVSWQATGTGLYDQPAPTPTGSIVLNRRDLAGNKYVNDNSADTLTSAPINLQGKSGVWMTLSYQRGANSDSTIAGVTNRWVVGPELRMLDSNKAIVRGDSLIIEALTSSASTLNPTEAGWEKIAILYGGLDLGIKKFRIALPATYVHNHTRIRFRLAAKNDAPLFVHIPPGEDDDNWILDGFEINAASAGQTELEPLALDLGANLFTHIPRDVKFLSPKVTLSNNGLVTNFGSYTVRLVITDVLNREIYHRLQSIFQPPAHGDTTITFPQWQIEGSQGGQFTAKIRIEQNFNEMRRQNDTASFSRILYIDDRYAYDDGTSDTSGTMVVADPHFFVDFIPMTSDSLRGFDFFHVSSTGTTNWTVTFRDILGVTLASRSFSYNTLNRGFQRASINPIYLQKDVIYRIEFNMTQGFGLGGDGSRGLVLKAAVEKGPIFKYVGLYPTLLQLFRDQSGVSYLTADSLARNGFGGGPILPMVRFVYTGSATFLPVELVNFDARRSANGDVLLSFKTAKEENAARFEIERETEAGWVHVATAPAHNAHLGADYSAVDHNAPQTTSYYRLNQFDLDGSHMIAGYATASPFAGTTALSVSVLENPASDRLHATVSGITENGDIKLYDMLGKVVLTSSIANDGTLDLDVSSLSAGRYTLEVTSMGKDVRTPVVIHK